MPSVLFYFILFFLLLYDNLENYDSYGLNFKCLYNHKCYNLTNINMFRMSQIGFDLDYFNCELDFV